MAISKEQIEKLLEEFKPDEIEFLPKGGRKLAYVTHQACTRRLIDVFGLDWSFEIVETRIEGKEAAVLGKLTCVAPGTVTLEIFEDGLQEAERTPGVRVSGYLRNCADEATALQGEGDELVAHLVALEVSHDG